MSERPQTTVMRSTTALDEERQGEDNTRAKELGERLSYWAWCVRLRRFDGVYLHDMMAYPTRREAREAASIWRGFRGIKTAMPCRVVVNEMSYD